MTFTILAQYKQLGHCTFEVNEVNLDYFFYPNPSRKCLTKITRVQLKNSSSNLLILTCVTHDVTYVLFLYKQCALTMKSVPWKYHVLWQLGERTSQLAFYQLIWMFHSCLFPMNSDHFFMLNLRRIIRKKHIQYSSTKYPGSIPKLLNSTISMSGYVLGLVGYKWVLHYLW